MLLQNRKLLRWRGGRCCGLLAAAVTLEYAGRGELSQLVPDHVLSDKHLSVLPAVVNQERVADELRANGAVARPGFERLLAMPELIDLGQQPLIDVRPFFH